MDLNPFAPAQTRVSQYGVDPGTITKRAAELEGITGIHLSQLIGGQPQTIYPSEVGIKAVRDATIRTLEGVDFSKITRGSTVNILASHHGSARPETKYSSTLFSAFLENSIPTKTLKAKYTRIIVQSSTSNVIRIRSLRS